MMRQASERRKMGDDAAWALALYSQERHRG
jgi:hypothetical protein